VLYIACRRVGGRRIGVDGGCDWEVQSNYALVIKMRIERKHLS
jgi:hypothetical protein